MRNTIFGNKSSNPLVMVVLTFVILLGAASQAHAYDRRPSSQYAHYHHHHGHWGHRNGFRIWIDV